MNKAIKYRIYPNDGQKELFLKTFGCCRKVWNLVLADREAAYKRDGSTLKPTPAINKTIFPDAELRDAYCVGGCDLSSTYDLTCATMLLKKNLEGPWIVLQKYFLPESRLEEIDKQNEPEAPYRLWAEQGWLTVCEGTQVRNSDVTAWFVEMVRERGLRPLWVGYDRALAGAGTKERQHASSAWASSPE